MNVKVVGKRAFIEPEVERVSPGGLILPDTARLKITTGKVLAVGEKCESGVAEGDRVMFRQHAEEEIEVEGRKVFMVHENDIHAILKE